MAPSDRIPDPLGQLTKHKHQVLEGGGKRLILEKVRTRRYIEESAATVHDHFFSDCLPFQAEAALLPKR